MLQNRSLEAGTTASQGPALESAGP